MRRIGLSMIKEIEAKTLLSSAKHPDGLFGIKYTMNLYHGCQHQCIYCDSRSECYQIENFADILIKRNAIDLLKREIPSKRVVGTIGTGSMNDPYMPLEKRLQLTRQALEVIAQHHFPVHIITKSDLVLRDMDVISDIAHVYAAVSFTITTADDALARILEPGAPVSSARFDAIRQLAAVGVYTGITMMPVMPFIADHAANVSAIVERAAEVGARYILPWFGLSMRDRQRAYLYQKLDQHFPGLRARYTQQYGDRYECASPVADELWQLFAKMCELHGIATHMEHFTPRARTRTEAAGQLRMLGE